MLKIDGGNEAAWKGKNKYAERSAVISVIDDSKKKMKSEIKKEECK